MASQYTYVDSTGVIVPDTQETLTVVQDEFKTALGQDLIVTSDTPQGVLIAGETIARNNFINNNALIANQINPNISEGIFLDALLALMGVQRVAATPSVVPNVTLTGVPGTVIPEGSQASTAAGDLFGSVSIVTLDGSGNATVDFQSVETGPIPCGANDLNIIVSNVLGWETVDNATAATVGTAVMSDQQARAYRNNTLGFQGVALAECIMSALYAVEGVKSLTFQENTASTTQVINGISMVAHSVYACVDGGTDEAVAAALLENKSSGAAWNGGTTVAVVEPSSGQSYDVKFDRPNEVSLLIRVTTTNGVTANIQQAVLDYAAGQVEGFSGFAVGSDVSPFEISAAICALYPNYYISKVELSEVSPVSYSTDAYAIAVDEIAATQLAYITVVIT